jgi:polysaccharide biosynthesis protein PslH
LARGISQRAHLTYLGFSTSAISTAWHGKVGFEEELDCILVPRPATYSLSNLLRGLAGPLPVTVLNFTTAAMRVELERILGSEPFDLVQMEGVHLYSYLPTIAAAPGCPRVIADWHNIESELIRRYSENLSPLLPTRWYAARTARLVESLEPILLEQCQANLVCSERERQVLLARSPGATIRVVENGVDAGGPVPVPKARLERRDLVFVGSMDYHANIDAALYFAREIWPALHQRRPDLRFVIVGSRPTPEVLALGRQAGIVVTGTVDSVGPYYDAALAAVVPLRVGSGTRLKVLEAMAAGVPVISTSLGAEGLAVTEGKHLILADTPAAFTSAVVRLAGDDAEWMQIAIAGRELAASRYDWSGIAASLYEFYEEVISARGR